MSKQTLVFYDGSCPMCVGVSGWLSRIDGKKQFRLEPYQKLDLLARYPELNFADCEREIHIITEEGKVLKGADAVIEIWKKTQHWTSFLARILVLPPFIWIARIGYRIVAFFRNRF